MSQRQLDGDSSMGKQCENTFDVVWEFAPQRNVFDTPQNRPTEMSVTSDSPQSLRSTDGERKAHYAQHLKVLAKKKLDRLSRNGMYVYCRQLFMIGPCPGHLNIFRCSNKLSYEIIDPRLLTATQICFEIGQTYRTNY